MVKSNKTAIKSDLLYDVTQSDKLCDHITDKYFFDRGIKEFKVNVHQVLT